MRTEYPVAPALRPYVRCLWSVERTFVPPADTFDLLPDRYVELVFTAGARFTIDAGPRTAGTSTAESPVLPRAYVVGLLDGPVRPRARGTVRAVAARCDAWSAAPIVALLVAPRLEGPARTARPGGRTPAAACGGVRPLHPAHAPLADAIAARLDAGDVGGALGLLQDALRAFAADAAPAPVRRAGLALGGPPDDPLDAAGVGGGATVRAAAAAGGRTPRQLERQFRALAGVTPKGYARRARFERARDRLWAAPATRLSALAAECGYADQAHLTREFTAFAGQPPGRWAVGVARTRALLRPEPSPRVAFLQDG